MNDSETIQRSLFRIILACLAGLFALGLLSFWVQPSYEKGVWTAMEALMNALSAALGAKFGLAQASPAFAAYRQGSILIEPPSPVAPAGRSGGAPMSSGAPAPEAGAPGESEKKQPPTP